MRLRHLPIALAATLFLLPAPGFAALEVNAGEDATLECESPDGTEYTLNGEVNSDRDESEISVEWTSVPPVDFDDPESLTPTGTFPLGETIATLSAEDALSDDTGSDDVTVTVVDSTPPVARAKADPAILWPPNHRMVEVEVHIRLRDRCSERGDLQVELVSVESNEPDNGTGDGNTTDDIQEADLGTDDRHVLLRAERKGNGHGRIYTLVYKITDGDGNRTRAVARVRVPHDWSDMRDDDSDSDSDSDSDGGSEMGGICPSPDDAVDEFTSERFPELESSLSRRLCLASCRAWARGCSRVTRGAAQCRIAEGRAIGGVAAVECRNHENPREARACLERLRERGKNFASDLREEASESADTCANRGRRCANACADLFERWDGDE